MAKRKSEKSKAKSVIISRGFLKKMAKDLRSGNCLDIPSITVECVKARLRDKGEKIGSKNYTSVSLQTILEFEQGKIALVPIKPNRILMEAMGGLQMRKNLWYFFPLQYNVELTAKGLVICGMKIPPKAYVHQFQNIFYAITGQELNVDLERIKKLTDEKLGKKK